VKKVSLYLENGIFLQAKSFGATGTSVGEIVFNTSMSGYQEIITDPSYAGQFITFTMPEIGNVGCNSDDMESRSVFCKGVIVRNYQPRPSNFRSMESLHSLLEQFGTMGICEIDTRFLTKVLREEGSMMMIASTEIHDKSQLSQILRESPRIEDVNYIDEVSTKESYIHPTGCFDPIKFQYNSPKTSKKIVALDFGIKRNILNQLTQAGIEVEVVPNSIDAETLISRFENRDLDGVFLSSGPGDPLILKNEHETIRKLIAAKVPLLGISIGHQLLSIAHGYDTYKLKFGHHGGNHPVKNLATVAVEIAAQNHNYNVPQNLEDVAVVTHKNLFDGTIEGVRYKDSPAISVQYYPQGSPCSHESANVFYEFFKLLER